MRETTTHPTRLRPLVRGGGWGVVSLKPFLLLWLCVRRCPTLPPPLEGSTIGAEGLSFRVRNGSGRFPFAMTAGTCCEPTSTGLPHRGPDRVGWVWGVVVGSEPYSGRFAVFVSRASTHGGRGCVGQVLGLLVPVSFTHFWASTSGLSTQSSSWGPYHVNRVGDLILKQASRLDAFSGYPFRT